MFYTVCGSEDEQFSDLLQCSFIETDLVMTDEVSSLKCNVAGFNCIPINCCRESGIEA